MANVLITGGAGFIGSHTADALIGAGHRVRILDILDPQIHGQLARFPDYLPSAAECMQGDVRNRDDVVRALEDIDTVYHFAALTGVGQSMYSIRTYVETNCGGTATLLEVIAERKQPLKRLVLASSRAVYGEGTHWCEIHGTVYPEPRLRKDLASGLFDVHCPDCGKPVIAVQTTEDRPLMPLSIYAWTKKQQEELCRFASTTFGIPLTILRYFNVYGSRQSLRNPYTGVVSIFYGRILAGAPVYLYEHGHPGRDFVHISDVVQANLQAVSVETDTACINVGSGREITIAEVAQTLAAACGKKPDLRDNGEYRVGDIHSCCADLGHASAVLGYRPQVNFETGIQEFVDWARHEEAVDLYQQTVDELQRYNLFGRASG